MYKLTPCDYYVRHVANDSLTAIDDSTKDQY